MSEKWKGSLEERVGRMVKKVSREIARAVREAFVADIAVVLEQEGYATAPQPVAQKPAKTIVKKPAQSSISLDEKTKRKKAFAAYKRGHGYITIEIAAMILGAYGYIGGTVEKIERACVDGLIGVGASSKLEVRSLQVWANGHLVNRHRSKKLLQAVAPAPAPVTARDAVEGDLGPN